MGPVTKVSFSKCHEDAKCPTQNIGDVGWDLSCVYDAYIKPGKTLMISTGIKLGAVVYHPDIRIVPFFKIEGRSGMASRGVFPLGGVIDPAYCGEIKVVLLNITNDIYELEKGDRIAQLVCYLTMARTDSAQMVWDEKEEVVETDRGDKGFGSSGR